MRTVEVFTLHSQSVPSARNAKPGTMRPRLGPKSATEPSRTTPLNEPIPTGAVLKQRLSQPHAKIVPSERNADTNPPRPNSIGVALKERPTAVITSKSALRLPTVRVVVVRVS